MESTLNQPLPSSPVSLRAQARMTAAEQERFLAQQRVAVLSWVTPKGKVAATPIWFTYRDGAFLLHTNHPSTKTQAILKNDQVVLVIQDEAPPYRYVSVRGRARVRQEPQEALRLYEKQAHAYFGRLTGTFYLRRALSNYPGQHVIIEVTPAQIVAMNGNAAVSRAQLLVLRALRWFGL